MKKGIVGVASELAIFLGHTSKRQGNVTSVLIYLVAAYWTLSLFIWYHTIAVFHLVLDHISYRSYQIVILPRRSLCGPVFLMQPLCVSSLDNKNSLLHVTFAISHTYFIFHIKTASTSHLK